MTPSALRGVLGTVGLGGEWEEGRERRCEREREEEEEGESFKLSLEELIMLTACGQVTM